MKEVSFGQYYPVKSFVHNMNPALKILFLIAYIVAVFLAKNFYGLAACAGVLLIIIICSRVPILKILRAVKGILFMLIFTAVINVLFHGGEEVYWGNAETGVYYKYGIIQITQAGIVFSLFLIIRLVLLVICSSLLTYTTSKREDLLKRSSRSFPFWCLCCYRRSAGRTSSATQWTPAVIRAEESAQGTKKCVLPGAI